jgi:hypothetical protein
MAKSEVLLGLIKEVVKNEVKQQLKEEIVKLVKSGAISLNTKQNSNRPSLKESIKVNPDKVIKSQPKMIRESFARTEKKEFTKNPVLNEILNMTTPFTSAHRSEGGTVGGGSSILDSIQPERSMEGDWETLSYSNVNMPSHQIPPTDNVDALTKALTRDYSELVKRFK